MPRACAQAVSNNADGAVVQALLDAHPSAVRELDARGYLPLHGDRRNDGPVTEKYLWHLDRLLHDLNGGSLPLHFHGNIAGMVHELHLWHLHLLHHRYVHHPLDLLDVHQLLVFWTFWICGTSTVRCTGK